MLDLPAPPPRELAAVRAAVEAARAKAQGGGPPLHVQGDASSPHAAAVAAAAAAAALAVEAGPTQYGLFAVSVHSGESAQSGHYYTYARRSEPRARAAASRRRRLAGLREGDCDGAPWLLLNDETVTRVPWAEVARAVAGGGSASAYALLYRRLDEGDEGEGEAEPAKAEPAPAPWAEAVFRDNASLVRRFAGGASPALARFVRRAAALAAPAAEA